MRNAANRACLLVVALLALSRHLGAASLVVSAAERFEKPNAALVAREEQFWRRESLPLPVDPVIEISGILPVPNKGLLVTTRRGDIFQATGAYDDAPNLQFSPFASGLHEPLGIVASPKAGYYVVQRSELTHLIDRDGDGRVDKFEPVYRIPVSGNYHEFAFGPVVAPNGNLRVT